MKQNSNLGALAALLLATTLTACGGGGGTGGTTPGNGNSNTGNGYYLRVSVNGAAPIDFSRLVAFNISNANATVGAQTDGFSVGGLSFKETAPGFPAFSIGLNRPAVLQIGVPYTLPGNYSMQATYNFDGFDRYEAARDPENFFIILDSISATEVKGHFGGRMQRTTDNSSINVTGEFYAPVKS